jgi:hypothetical protein
MGLGQAIFDPGRCPTDKIGAKQGELFLDLHANGRTDQMTFQGKDPFFLFNASFHNLAAVVLLEPLFSLN